MKNPIIFIFFLIFLYSCVERTTYYNIPEENKPLLTNKDTLFFIDSINNKIDSFYLTLYDHFDLREHSSEEIISLYYKKLNKSSTLKNFHILQLTEYASISVNEYSFSRSINSIDNNSIILKKDLKIRGITYPEVYWLTAYDFPDSISNTVYYTFKYGIIRYEYKDGRKYEIMNNLMVK